MSTGGKFFRTTDGGDTWATSRPAAPRRARRPRNSTRMGRYFTSIVSKGGIWRYASGSWTNLQPRKIRATLHYSSSIPTNDQQSCSSRIVQFRLRAVERRRHDVEPDPQLRRRQPDVGRRHPLALDQSALLPGEHPGRRHAKRACGCPGETRGSESIPLSALSGSPPYTCDMHGLGIENMCINMMVAATGSKKLHAVVWDEWYAQLDRDNVAYPSIVNPMKGHISPSWGLDGCKQTPTLLARWLDGAAGSGAEFAQSGWSADDGATWNAFATLPASTTGASDWGYGGELAYSGKTTSPSCRRTPMASRVSTGSSGCRITRSTAAPRGSPSPFRRRGRRPTCRRFTPPPT